jgi:hypothetical protein
MIEYGYGDRGLPPYFPYDHQEEVDQDIARRVHKAGEIQSRLGDSPLARRLKGLKNQP